MITTKNAHVPVSTPTVLQSADKALHHVTLFYANSDLVISS